MKAIYVGASTLALLAFPMSYRAWVGCAGDDGDIETTEDPSVDASSADERTSGTPGVEATGPGYSVIYGRAQDPSPQLTASALANAPSASAPPAPPVEGETDEDAVAPSWSPEFDVVVVPRGTASTRVSKVPERPPLPHPDHVPTGRPWSAGIPPRAGH